MIPIKRINKLELASAVRILNESGLLKETIKSVCLTKEELIQSFSYEIEHLSEEEQEQLPEIVKEMYNFIYQDEDVNGSRFTSKHLKKVSSWGSVEGSQGYILDEMIQIGGFTIEEMARAVCSNKTRVRRHLHERKHEFNHHYVIYQGKYYMKPNEEVDSGIRKNERIIRGFDFGGDES